MVQRQRTRWWPAPGLLSFEAHGAQRTYVTERRIGTIATLALGPLLSVLALNAVTAGSATDQSSMSAVLVLLWCPFFFFSVPALLQQTSRDETLSTWSSPLASAARAVILVPYQMIHGQHRMEAMVSVAAWLFLAVALFEPTIATLERIAGTLL